MKHISHKIDLQKLINDYELDVSTSDGGQKLYSILVDLIQNTPNQDIFYLALKNAFFGASFAREGIVKVAKHFRMQKGVCLVDMQNEEILENLFSGIARLKQPIPYYFEGKLQLVHEDKVGAPSKTNAPIYHYVLDRELSTASEVADKFDLKVNNASTKLKALYEEGFLLRKEEKSATGGIEFFYFAIK
ncbi:winged helix-turn-helix domain-containing protein [Photobacterium chitinilyticum]|uniref:ArsR family transcriptional regulator n=1 Tax=Photobacterium chitinilyticum TaxID=2485123 RepID=A0A3S3SVD1_9GAMM|nr:helix-turn-helix domain-containing protein [Photobacterium chitinilyticum]RWX52889.1 ArsR family transcriptional regulator [Photobacterium chitinilyticum]